jgi:ABC-type Fe3+-siderophore transport system permease subunit
MKKNADSGSSGIGLVAGAMFGIAAATVFGMLGFTAWLHQQAFSFAANAFGYRDATTQLIREHGGFMISIMIFFGWGKLGMDFVKRCRAKTNKANEE